MAKMNERVQKLARLTHLVSDAQIARLVAAGRELGDLQAKFQALDDELKKRARAYEQAQGDPHDPAMLAGMDSRWQTWIAVRQVELQSQSAALAAAREEELRKAQVALGRVQAMESVVARLAAPKKPSTTYTS